MIVKPIEMNPLWPLPADYKELSVDGQRQARINGCRYWTLSYDDISRILYRQEYSTLLPDQKMRVMWYRGEAMVGSVRLFDHLYMIPAFNEEGEQVWNSMFYGTRVLPRPAFHDEGLRLHANSKYLGEVEPRGSAKTTDLRLVSLMKLVTKPGHEIVYTTASHPLAEITGSKLKVQLQDNAMLIDDWTPEYGGVFQPDRGDLPWGVTYFALRNRASFKISSVGSVQRGLRPDDYILDDPEWDPEASTDMQISRDAMDHLLRHVIVPMVQKPGSTLVWRGTFVSQRHYLWAAMENVTVVEDGVAKEMAAIPMFRKWTRRVVDVIAPDGHSIWKEMWPTDEAEKVALGLPADTQTLTQVEEDMGTPAFMAEMRGKPGSGGAAFFGEMNEEDHGYWFDDATLDESLQHHPHLSKTLVCWWRNKVLMKMSLKDFLHKFPTWVGVDPAYTENATSDFKVCTCMAVSDANELFVLDTWRSNKLPVGEMNKQAFQMAERWGSVAICPERVKQGNMVVAAMMEIVRTRASDVMGVKHLCQVRPVNPGVIDKTSKIAALLWRFQHGKIKLPVRYGQSDKWVALFNQIRDFNPNAADGGLKKDDDIDCVSQSQFVVKLPRVPGTVAPPEDSALERLRKGHKTDEFGFPIVLTLPGKSLTEDDLKCLNRNPPPRKQALM